MKNKAENIDNQQGNGVLPCVMPCYVYFKGQAGRERIGFAEQMHDDKYVVIKENSFTRSLVKKEYVTFIE